ncbi:hypothetical protein AVEN_109368-1 [Araneus ventricosus]|uniref:Uncharacterized protein n=1 Tax=Araneus ventricosus TaxID=182803 RepID=A0A4Y2J785_ARAVE|nr:hypothetical protein AVEN_109368-1 [Araneus ventricosus]
MLPRLPHICGTFTSVPIHFFGTKDVKPFLECEVPMRSFVHVGKIWISKVVGFSFIPFEHKSEIRFFEACDKSPGWRERCGGGMCESERGGKDALSKKGKSPFRGTGLWME